MPYSKPFARKISTDQVCDYGCQQNANFEFRNGKKCCSKHFNSCPQKRKDFSENVDHKEYSKRSLETRTRLGITKTSQIKGAKTRKENGFYEKMRVIMQNHWKNNPWNTNPKWRKYKDTEISIQSSYEYKFLEDFENTFDINWVRDNIKRGPNFKYRDCELVERVYMSDFIIGNTIYEIKSFYTWNNCGTNKDIESNNYTKLNSVLDAGYNIILVLEGEYILYDRTLDGKI